VILYTVIGGSDAVTVTQKYQMAIIFAGMLTATALLISKLPPHLHPGDAIKLAGSFHKMNAVDFSPSLNQRYTFWSGLLGGTFLMLSYFGTDQSQVQRYISGSSLRESRLGLLFNAVLKIPMQFSILLLGVLMFIFYQFQSPPLFFDAASRHYLESHQSDPKLAGYTSDFNNAQTEIHKYLNNWLDSRHRGDRVSANSAFVAASLEEQKAEQIRIAASKELTARNPEAKANDADYVFITFILQELPHGVIGLLVAAFFAATLSSKAAELNALGTSTTIDFYRRLIKKGACDAECLTATKWFTAMWGAVAITFALCAHLAENLIQAVNILGSIFYGVMLGLFLVAFFIRRVEGNAIFWGALIAQLLVFVLYFTLSISYLWYPLIGCAACILLSLIIQALGGKHSRLLEG
jgi:Na+/proline symporter